VNADRTFRAEDADDWTGRVVGADGTDLGSVNVQIQKWPGGGGFRSGPSTSQRDCRTKGRTPHQAFSIIAAIARSTAAERG
jgi:hypothetical protein